jgi:uncharacterized protein YkwD
MSVLPQQPGERALLGKLLLIGSFFGVVMIAAAAGVLYGPQLLGLETDGNDTSEQRTPDPAQVDSDETRTVTTAKRTAVPEPERLELLIHRYVNEERTAVGLDPLEYNETLATIAANHSAEMAEYSYFDHQSRQGWTVAERYEYFGSNCSVDRPASTFNRGGENILKTYSEERVRLPDGSLGSFETKTALAKGIVAYWMADQDQRDAIMSNVWNHEGIGVTFSTNNNVTAVYVTQNFC